MKTIIIFNQSNQLITLIYNLLSINAIPLNYRIIILQGDQTEDRQPTLSNLSKLIDKTQHTLLLIGFSHVLTNVDIQLLLKSTNIYITIIWSDYEIKNQLDLPYKIYYKKLRLNKLIKHQLHTDPVTKTSNSTLDELIEADGEQLYPYTFVESIGEHDTSSNESPTLLNQVNRKDSKFYVKLEYERQYFPKAKHQKFEQIITLLIKDVNPFQFANTISNLFHDLHMTLKAFCDLIIVDYQHELMLESSYPLNLDNSVY